MNKLDAYKMDGLGNDFIIFDRRNKSISLTKDQIIKISARDNIGCDQVIFISPDKKNDAYLTFYNSNGEEANACGNGSRCVAYLLMKNNNKKKISLKTKGGILYAELNNNLINLNIGQPKFHWKDIPLNKEMNNKNLKININDKGAEEIIEGFSLNVGNPHIIFFVKDLNKYDLKKIGPKIENHDYFPEQCNVTFAKVINKNLIKVKVWERGAGLTKACGTAACATAVAGITQKLVERLVNIEFEKGSLSIEWNLDNNIHMNGEVSAVKEILVNI